MFDKTLASTDLQVIRVSIQTRSIATKLAPQSYVLEVRPDSACLVSKPIQLGDENVREEIKRGDSKNARVRAPQVETEHVRLEIHPDTRTDPLKSFA
jgi:hypothetical protein